MIDYYTNHCSKLLWLTTWRRHSERDSLAQRRAVVVHLTQCTIVFNSSALSKGSEYPFSSPWI